MKKGLGFFRSKAFVIQTSITLGSTDLRRG